MLHFLSPLPPKKTGTADYLLQLLVDLEIELGPNIKKHIKLWDRFESAKDKFYFQDLGWQVGDVADIEFVDDDIIFYFLASNDFHRWIWAMLAKRGNKNAISVVHDLTAFPMIRSMSRDSSGDLSRKDELLALRYEFGMQSEWFVDHFEDLTPTARYFMMGQGITLACSDTVILHSEYARMRLVSETIPGLPMPNIIVLGHPRPRPMPNVNLPNSAPESGYFCIGSIGFYSTIKRNDVLLEAFGAFVRNLDSNDRSRVRLFFVGKIEDHLRLDAQKIISRWNIKDFVKFTGYVDEVELQGWQQRIDLQINLRFPSCGETSGTLARAIQLGKRVVCSRFAAFHEEASTWKVSVDPIAEFSELLHILNTEFLRWKSDDHDTNGLEYIFPEKMQFPQYLNDLLGEK